MLLRSGSEGRYLYEEFAGHAYQRRHAHDAEQGGQHDGNGRPVACGVLEALGRYRRHGGCGGHGDDVGGGDGDCICGFRGCHRHPVGDVGLDDGGDQDGGVSSIWNELGHRHCSAYENY